MQNDINYNADQHASYMKTYKYEQSCSCIESNSNNTNKQYCPYSEHLFIMQ